MPSTNIDNVIKMKSNLWICVRILSNANMKVASKKRICSIRARGYDGVMSRSEFTLLLPPSSSGTAQCHRSHGETALLISTNDDKMIRNFISLWKRKAQQQTNGKKTTKNMATHSHSHQRLFRFVQITAFAQHKKPNGKKNNLKCTNRSMKWPQPIAYARSKCLFVVLCLWSASIQIQC